MEEIRSLKEVSPETLYAAQSEAFRAYARQWTRAEFEKMLHRRGYVPELSFGAFDNPGLVSFTLNGTGMYDGIRTAYDTGTGTIQEYRGKGLATKIFTTSLPWLQQAGIKQYILEVLQENSKAISVYTNIGFSITREFNYFIQNVSLLHLGSKPIPERYTLQEMDLTRHEEMTDMWDFTPSWQNSFDAILRNPDDFRIAGVFDCSKLIGYGIIEPASGDIPQLAVDRVYRRRGIGSAILKKLVGYNNHASVKLINTESACGSMTSFLAQCGMPVSGKQFEMRKQLIMTGDQKYDCRRSGAQLT